MQRTILHNLLLRFILILFLALLVGTLLHLIALRRERLSLHSEAAQQLASVIAREVERLPIDTDTTAISRLTPLCRQLVQSTPFVDYCVVTDSSGKMLAWSYPNGEPNSIHFVTPPLTGDRNQNVFLLGKRNRFYDTLQTVERGKAGSLVIHAGFAEEKFVSVLRPHIAQAAGILALILILSSLFILRTVQRHIENQVASLLVAAQGLAAGAL
ncbi:MAG TPA: hypothetical protein VFR01_02745, partial [Geobacterales bacterium]|nr:hypothetical protein [Geobacterales bacterium]